MFHTAGKLKNLVCIILLNFSIFNGFSSERAGQDLVLPGSWVYDALRSIEMEMARVTFSDQAPISIDELKYYLTQIDYERLSAPGKKQYERIEEYIHEKNFSFDAGIFSIGIEPSVNPEFYFKTSDSSIPWIYDYTQRQALLSVPVQVRVGDYLSLYMGFAAMQMYTLRFSSDNYFNQIFTEGAFDGVLTHENYLSAGYMWDNGVGLNLRFGTGTQSLGQTMMPGIIISEHFTDAPFINLRVFSPIFNYDLNVTQLTRESFFYSHRLEFLFFKKLELSFMEGVVPHSQFDLRFIDPFGIYHGYGMFGEFREFNSFFGAKISFSPCQYLRLYGLYAQNEHTMASENSGDPEGMGFQLGTVSSIPCGNGYIHAGLEMYYATPYLYIKNSPNVSFAKVFNELCACPHYYEWLGNPLGPDTIAFQVNLGYEVPEVYSVDLAYNFAAKGEFAGDRIFKDVSWEKNGNFDSDKWIYKSPDRNLTAPHGKIEYVNSIYAKGTWYTTPWLTLMLTTGYTFVFNSEHDMGKTNHGFEISLSTRIDLTKISKKRYSTDFLFTDNK